jgi:hypothetical protein
LQSLKKAHIDQKKPQFLWKCLQKQSKSLKKPQITLKKPQFQKPHSKKYKKPLILNKLRQWPVCCGHPSTRAIAFTSKTLAYNLKRCYSRKMLPRVWFLTCFLPINSLMTLSDILRVCLLSAHLNLKCKFFLTEVATIYR